MTFKAFVFLTAVAWTAAIPALADGTVMRAKGCGDKIFVTTEAGYTVLIASQSDAAKDGDRLIGNTDKIGPVSICHSIARSAASRNSLSLQDLWQIVSHDQNSLLRL